MPRKGEPKVESKIELKEEPRVEPKVEPKIEPKPESKPVVRDLVEPAKPTRVPAIEAEPPAKSTKGLKLILAAAAATALFVLLFVYPGLLRQSSKGPKTPQGDASPLQLRVERTNDGNILLTWNRDAAAIQGASKAMLEINDGQQHESVVMDLPQLRNGSIVYSPQTADISFKMEVSPKDASSPISESVRVLRTRPSALDQSKQSPPLPTAPATSAAPAAAPTGTPAEPTPEPEAQPESRPVTPTRSFNAQSLSARLRPTQSTDLPEAPVTGRTSLTSAAIPGISLSAVGARPTAPAPVAPPPPPVEAKGAAKTGGQIQQAVLIYKKDPEYPKLARQTGAKGAVRLTATVGKDGKVKAVKVLSGHPMLQAAAVEAVKQWLYKPTLLNGQPVETDTEIQLNFVGDR